MRKFSAKQKVAAGLGAGAIAVAGGGIAYAYWTDTGSGTGSAATGTAAGNITLTGTNTTDELIPGGSAVQLSLTAANPNTYSASISGDSLHLGTVKCGTTDVTSDGWFSLVHASLAGVAVVAPGATAQALSPTTPITIQMANDPSNSQDVCGSNAAVTFTFTVS